MQNSALQASFEVNYDKKNYYLKCGYECSNKTILKLISEGKAAYITHVECTNTVFRGRFATSEHEQSIPIPADALNGTVEVNFFVCAIQPIANYTVIGAHPDYGKAQFSITRGDILALTDGRTFNAERDTNSLRRVSSIMQIEQSKDEGDRPMEISFGSPKIRIILSKPDFDDYKFLKSQEHLQSALAAAIVIPALVEALHLLRDEESGYNSYRWYQNLRHRLDDLGISGDFEPLTVAQKLLELPLRRSLQQAKAALLSSS